MMWRAIAGAWLLGSLSLLGGCVGSSVVSAPDDFVSPVRLASASVVWVKNPALKIHISKTGYMAPPPILAEEQANAQLSVSRLAAAIEHVGLPLLRKGLKDNGVATGSDATLEIEPTSATYIVGGSRMLFVRVSVRPAGAEKPAWSEDIRVFGLLSKPDRELLDTFVATVMSELKRVHWLS